MNKKAIIIGISGGSCSGKTFFAKALQNKLGKSRAIIFCEDWYYFDQSQRFDTDGGVVNFDHPSSLDFQMMEEHLLQLAQGHAISAPLYDFVTHTRLKQTKTIEPHEVIIVDGMLILSQSNIFKLLDCAVYIHADENLRLQRRLVRDVKERGREQCGVYAQFERHVKPMHQQYVEVYKNIATHLVTDDISFAEVMTALIDQVNKKNFSF